MNKEIRKFVITGSTSGIGKETALNLLKNGDFVYAIARNKDKAEEIFKDFKNKVSIIQINLEEPQSIEHTLYSELSEKIDGPILCGGIEETLPLKMYNNQRLQHLFNINFFSNFELIRILTSKKFSKMNASHVVLSSIMSVNAQPGKTAYCASKSALLGLVRASALELANRKIRINAISPGVVMSPMTDNLFSQLSEENKNKIKSMHPLNLGELSDIANLILFLIENNSKWITGQNYIIDGGYSIQ